MGLSGTLGLLLRWVAPPKWAGGRIKWGKMYSGG